MNLSAYAHVLGIKEQLLSIVGEGQNGIILTDGSGMAFKFPKHELGTQQLKREIEMIHHIAQAISVEVPSYNASHLNHPVGEAYCTYALIPGVQLSKELYVKHRQKLATQLLSLLDEIHGISPLETMAGNKMDFEEMYHDIQKLIFPLVEDEVKRDIESRFEAYLQNMSDVEQGDCVVHGDLGSANILCDPATGTVTGIIDWAEVTLDDPLIDYSSLTCAAGIPLCKDDLLLLRPSLSGLFQRSDFIQYTFPLQEALQGVKTNDEAAVKSGLSGMAPHIKRA